VEELLCLWVWKRELALTGCRGAMGQATGRVKAVWELGRSKSGVRRKLAEVQW